MWVSRRCGCNHLFGNSIQHLKPQQPTNNKQQTITTNKQTNKNNNNNKKQQQNNKTTNNKQYTNTHKNEQVIRSKIGRGHMPCGAAALSPNRANIHEVAAMLAVPAPEWAVMVDIGVFF
jgi:mannitol-specific phosphotransferase system IIBC component